MNNRVRDILLMRKTGKVVSVASRFDKSLGLYLNDRDYGGVITTTTTGNPVSIATNKAQNAISTLLSYSPKQSGTGDPSPQNIRPIVPWTEASLTGAGKNLIDISALATTSITYSDGVLTGTAGAFNAAYGSGIPFDCSKFHGVQIAISAEAKVNVGTPSTTNGLIIRIVYTDGTSDSITWKNNDTEYSKKAMVSNASKTVDYIRMLYASGGSNVWNVREMQIEVSSQATDYAPYIAPTTLTVSLGGTYYGFSVDLERGVLRDDTEYLTLDGTEDWASVSSGDSKYFRLNYAETGYRSNNGLCDQYTRTSVERNNTDVGFNLAFSSGYYQFRFRPENVSSVNTGGWKTMLANQPVHVIIYRSEPIEIPLTPQIVTLLKGNNTLWTDGDSLSVTYKAKKA